MEFALNDKSKRLLGDKFFNFILFSPEIILVCLWT